MMSPTSRNKRFVPATSTPESPQPLSPEAGERGGRMKLALSGRRGRVPINRVRCDTARGRRGRAMDQLWAPWRLSYVAAAKAPADADPCFICRGLAGDDDRANLVVLRAPLSTVLLNRFPYNNGHLL